VAAPAPDELYRGATSVFAAIIIAFGLVIVGVTLANGGGITALGIWMGIGFVGLGAGRLYLALRARD
jgi:hypothetical protein